MRPICIKFTPRKEGACEMLYSTLRTLSNKGWIDAGYTMDTIRQEKRVEFCRWTWDDEKWSTGCGEAFCFIDGGPSENGMKYCTYCGKRLIEAEERGS